jgi:hypothetical protein
MSYPQSESPAVPAENDGRRTPRATRHHRRKVGAHVASLARWLHVYLSMAGLFVLLFFSITGITLNHPDWFGASAERSTEAEGTLDPRWVKVTGPPAEGAGSDPARDVARLEVVEHLRKAHGVRGALAGFTADERECVATFKGPGYSADAFIDRETGRYRLTQTSHGLVAVINDLHKGRDTGKVWSLVIDLSAAVMTLASVTGLVLIFYIRRRRVPGLITALVATAVVVAVVLALVP